MRSILILVYKPISIISDPLKLEIAQNFKEQGNEYFKGKRYREAISFYKQGIDAKPEDQTILEALLCNMAACNLELGVWLISSPDGTVLTWRVLHQRTTARFLEIARKPSLSTIIALKLIIVQLWHY